MEVDGDTAKVTMPGQPEPLGLKRVDGQWRMLAKDIMSGDPGQADMWVQMAKAIGEAQTRVGQGGVTPESLDKELGEAVMSVLMSGS